MFGPESVDVFLKKQQQRNACNNGVPVFRDYAIIIWRGAKNELRKEKYYTITGFLMTSLKSNYKTIDPDDILLE